MTRIILARHGETDHNAEGLLQGQTDVALNEDGIDQARQLAERLAEEDIDAVYTSDLERAAKTAEIIAVEHDLEPEPLEALRERSFGEAEGEDKQVRGEAVEDPDDLDAWTSEGGERLDEVQGRVRPVINDLRKRHRDGTVVLVGHDWVNRSILSAALGTDSGHAHRIRQGNACLNELEYEDYRGWRINRVNDTAHIQ